MAPNPDTAPAQPPEVLTAEEVADLLRMTPGNVRRLARDGEIPATRIGGSWRFSRDRIVALLAPAEALA